ncbi:MAG: hypothetical protein B6U75_02805, partial [Desulfurococcales archaeon ex4484_217_1]
PCPKQFQVPLVAKLIQLTGTGNHVEKIMREAHEGALKLEAAIVGGHSEVVAGLRNRPPIVIVSALGYLSLIM